jgi:hypothetical protein
MEVPRWFDRHLTPEEFRQFVIDAKESPANTEIKQAYIGDIVPEAALRIKAVCGASVSKIMIDNGQIRHAYRKANHNLEDDDIFRLVEIINTATDITLSERKFLHNQALLFVKDISGEITFLIQVRIEFGGWLAFGDCWRRKRKR